MLADVRLTWLGVGRVKYLHVGDEMAPVASMAHDGEQYRDGEGLPLGPVWKVAVKALEDGVREARSGRRARK
jgi:hypothetical protein